MNGLAPSLIIHADDLGFFVSLQQFDEISWDAFLASLLGDWPSVFSIIGNNIQLPYYPGSRPPGGYEISF